MKETYKYEAHNFTLMKHIGKQKCKRCGLLALRNELTSWCIEKGCYYEDHPQHDATVKKLTRIKD